MSSCTLDYWCVIVSALVCTIFELFYVEKGSLKVMENETIR